MIGLYVLADEFVPVVLGHQWVAMIPILKILSIVGLFQSISAINGSLFLAMDATKIQLRISIFSGIFVVSFILLGIYLTNNIIGVAAYYAFASSFVMIPIWIILGRLIDLSVFSMIKNLLPVLGSALMMGTFLAIIDLLPFWQLNIISVITKSILGVLIYLIIISFFKIDAYAESKIWYYLVI